MYKLPAALARAVYFKSEKPDARKSHLLHLVAYHKFAVPIEHDGALALAIMHVEEDRQGHFYYDASVTPQIETPDDRTSGMDGTQTNQVPSPRQAYYEYIKEALNVKFELSEIHTFFRKSLSEIVEPLKVEFCERGDGAEPFLKAARLGIDHGDEVFYAHPAHGLASGKVIAHGKDGFTVAHESGPLGIPWEDYHGHKSRKERHFTPVEQGEDGMIAEESGSGRRVYLHGEIPDKEEKE
jgi:hypothetical protein